MLFLCFDTMQKEQCFELGAIQKAKGLAGELVLFLDVDDPSHYEALDIILIENKAQLIPHFITQIRIQGERAYIFLEGIDHVDKTSEFVGSKVYLPLERLPKLPEGEFYLHEIIGYTLIDQNKGELGTVENIYESHQDLLVFYHQGKEILVPIAEGIVLHANHNKKELHVNLPEGLIDIYLEE